LGDNLSNAHILGLGLTQFFIALFITALGFGAHYFKRKSQKWYGNLEIFVGFLTALFVGGTLKPGSLISQSGLPWLAPLT
jgi:4-hydroxybenzoate polyprenyltransferase